MQQTLASICSHYTSLVAFKDANFALEVELIKVEIYKKLEYCRMMAGEFQYKITREIKENEK